MPVNGSGSSGGELAGDQNDPASGAQQGQKRPVDIERAEHIDAENALKVRAVHFNQRIQQINARVVQDGKQLSGVCLYLRGGLPDALLVGDVAFQPLDVFARLAAPAVKRIDAVSLFAQHSNGRASHTAGRAGHQNGFHFSFLPSEKASPAFSPSAQ